MAKKMINASNNKNKANKTWQQQAIHQGVNNKSHHEIYQQIDSVTLALNKQRRSKPFSHAKENHKGPKI